MKKRLNPLNALVLLVIGAAACGPPAGPGAPRPPEPRPAVEPDGEPEPELPVDRAVVRIGVVVPQTGEPTLQRYGELILEGVRLAAEAYTDAGRQVELMIRDDGGVPSRTARLVAELEAAGVVGVVGPLLPDAVPEAARVRQSPDLVLVSPTAGTLPQGLANVYSVNADETRGAEALAEYAVRAGLDHVALLFPFMPQWERQAMAFADALRAAGGRVAAEVGYPPGTTTFSEPLAAVRASGANAVFIPAPPRDVRQLAPQLAYYGLTGDGVRILGGESWTDEEILRMVAARHLEGVIAVTTLFRESPEVGWTEFVDRYESTYRRLLDNPYPALGYDATLLLLAGQDGAAVTARDVAARVGVLDGVRGATGIFSVQGGAVLRRPFIVQIRDGQLRPAR